MDNLLGKVETLGIKLNEKDQSFMDRLNKKLADGIMSENDYNTSKTALYSKYASQIKEIKKEEVKVEVKKEEVKKEEVKIEEVKIVEEKKEEKFDMPDLENQEMPSLENQEMPGLENQEMPGLENQEMPNLDGAGEGESNQSRAEKKARKAFSKLGLKVFPNVKRVTIKQAQLLFFIPKPEVYKLGNSYVIFGKVSYQDISKKGLTDLKNKFGKESENVDEEIPTLEEIKEEIVMDSKENSEIQVEEKDIELIQKSCPNATREEMEKAYKDNAGDVVNSIMELKSKQKK